MSTGDAVREVKEKLDIVEVISGYVRLQRAGRDYKGLCPFHSEKSPSFTVSGEKQVWYCFGCGEGGDVIRFVEKAESTDFAQTLQALAERAGVVLDDRPGGRRRARERERAKEVNRLAAQYFHYVLREHRLGARGLRYLRERGVEDESIAGFEIGYAPAGRVGDNLLRFLRKKGVTDAEAAQAGLALSGRGGPAIDRFRGRLMFPIRDDAGAVVAFGGRAMDATPPKYLNSPQTAIYDKGRTIFGLSHARKAIAAAGRALLVEGYFDVVMAHQHGIQIAVASSGTAVTEDQVRSLRRLATDLLLCLDSDPAGVSATERAIELASRAGMRVRVVELPNAKDPGEFFQRTPQLWDAAEGASLAGWEWWIDVVLKGFGDLRRADNRAAAAQAVVRILNRIPEEASLDIYCQLAAERLRVDAARLLADVQRLRRGELPREPEALAALSPIAPRNPAATGANGHHPADPADEDRLLELLLVDPRARRALADLAADEPVGSDAFRELCAQVGELLDSGSTLERHLERFPAETGARIARLSLTAPPPGDEAEMRAALHHLVGRIRLRDYASAMADLEAKLSRGPAEDERARILTRLNELARLRAAIRERGRQGRG